MGVKYKIQRMQKDRGLGSRVKLFRASGSGFTRLTLKPPKGVVVLGAGFRRDTPCLSAFAPT